MHLSVQWVLAVEGNLGNRCSENWSAVWTYVQGKGLCKDISHHLYYLLWALLLVGKGLLQKESPHPVSSPKRAHFLHGPLFYLSPLIPGLCLKWGLPKEGDKRGRGEGILVGQRHRKRIYEKRKKEENSYTIPSFQKWKEDQVFQGTPNKERINPLSPLLPWSCLTHQGVGPGESAQQRHYAPHLQVTLSEDHLPALQDHSPTL